MITIEPNKNIYEYDVIQLKNLSSKYIRIPMSIIVDNVLDTRRIGILSYLNIHCGLNNVVGFTVPDMVEWCGGKPDKRVNGTNDKFLNMLDNLSDKGYLTYLKEPSRSSFMKCEFNLNHHYQECLNGFSVLYLDEIEKILSYKKENIKDAFLTNTTILLVFAYLRWKIIRRPNKLQPEYATKDGLEKRKRDCPDAYADSFLNMSEEIGIPTKTFIKAVDILECQLGLIVTDRPYRIKDDNGEYRTPYTIFSNAYKREGSNLLITEKEYSRIEAENKSILLNKKFNNYKIDKNKRK